METVSPRSPDPLLATQVFWEKYKSLIIAGIVMAILVTCALGAYRFYTARRAAGAAELLAKAKEPADHRKIISDYAGTGAAASARLLLAARLRDQQQFAEANTTLQEFIKSNPKHELVTTAKMAMAANLESLGKADEALELLRRIAADNPQSFNAPLALLAQVHLLKQKGQIDEARRVCDTVLTQYRESYASSEASRYLRTLKASGAPVGANSQSPAAPAANANVEADASATPQSVESPTTAAVPTP